MWRPLLTFVNDALKVVPSLSGAAKNSIDGSKAAEVRNVLWENEAILDRFIEENPTQLPSEDLDVLKTWKYHRQGDFILFKVLKKYSIFISQDKTNDVFAVKGLHSSFEDIFGPCLPIMINTVLLPFNDEIVTDGLFQSYNLTFGSGYRSQFKSIYDDAKELGAIITTLLPNRENPSRDSQLSKAQMINTKVLDAFQKHEYQSGLNPKTVERDILSVKTYAENQLSQSEPSSLRELRSKAILNYLSSLPDKERKPASLSLKRLISFLRDTGRIDWNESKNLLQALKQA
ncbi:MAG: hypothetical protein NTZ74_14225 [Chloroflexi bacterium]|nr:hypothetical protein [Chloroflexota bacterium]